MNIRPGLIALLAAAGLLVGCSDGPAPPPVEADAQASLATVNGVRVTEAQLEAFMRLRRQNFADAAARQRSLAEYIDLMLLAREARATGLEDDQTLAEIEVQRVSLLANKALTEFARAETITDEQLQSEYSRQIGVTGGREYLLHHIMVADENSAADILARLQEGVEFDLLAAAAAPELGEGNAGEIGWVNLAQVPASFADPLSLMTRNSYAPRPIRSEYGWHVLYLKDFREFEPPEFEDVKEGIRSTLARQALENHLESLRAAADINRPAAQPAAEPQG
ncbi:MAG: peptidyl-prolyl cis-trans isomerase [Xanthomonadales bacterium]|nr:peptidyl-prolyl cis-trans isomerase [Xanthomonadales bacterium]